MVFQVRVLTEPFFVLNLRSSIYPLHVFKDSDKAKNCTAPSATSLPNEVYSFVTLRIQSHKVGFLIKVFIIGFPHVQMVNRARRRQRAPSDRVHFLLGFHVTPKFNPLCRAAELGFGGLRFAVIAFKVHRTLSLLFLRCSTTRHII